MVKSSVLLMSVFALGLTLGSGVEATKKSKEVTDGPMDRFVKRTPAPVRQDFKAKNKKIQRVTVQLKEPNPQLTSETLAYLLGRAGYTTDLTPFQKAWLLKNS